MTGKVPVFQIPEAVIYLEEFGGHTFGHCDVFKWSPRVAKVLRSAWNAITRQHGGVIYALHVPGDVKHLKWCELFGFKFFTSTNCDDGITRHVMACHQQET